MGRSMVPGLMCLSAFVPMVIGQSPAPANLSSDVTDLLAQEWLAPSDVDPLMKVLELYSRQGATDRTKAKALNDLEKIGANKSIIDLANKNKLNLPYLLASAARKKKIPSDSKEITGILTTLGKDITCVYTENKSGGCTDDNGKAELSEVNDSYQKGNYLAALYGLLMIQEEKAPWEKALEEDQQAKKAVNQAASEVKAKMADFNAKLDPAQAQKAKADADLHEANEETKEAGEKTKSLSDSLNTKVDAYVRAPSAETLRPVEEQKHELENAIKQAIIAAGKLKNAMQEEDAAAAAQKLADQAQTNLKEAQQKLADAQKTQEEKDSNLSKAATTANDLLTLMESYRACYAIGLCSSQLFELVHQMFH